MRTPLKKDLKSPLDIEATRITIFNKTKGEAYETSQNKLMRKIPSDIFVDKIARARFYSSHQVQGSAPDIRSVPESSQATRTL